MKRKPRPYTGVDNAVVRRSGTRLAALLVGLLCAFLLALVAVVYVRTQGALSESLHSELRTRAESETHHLTDPVSMPDAQHPITESLQEEQGHDGIILAFSDPQLHLIGVSTTPFGSKIPDIAAAAAAVQRGTPGFSTHQLGSAAVYLFYTLPVRAHGKLVGLVQTGASEKSYLQSLDALLQSLLLVCVLGVVAAGGITWLVVYRAMQPIRDAMRRQRDFVADAAHELRAPLAILRTAAELGIGPSTEEDQQDAMEQVLIQGNHLSRLVDDLALLARVGSGAIGVERLPLDLGALAAVMVNGMDMLAEEQGVQLHFVGTTPVPVLGDTGRLRQLLLILLDNALQHTGSGGAISVQVTRQGHQAQLQVRDSGTGIDHEHLPHLFERFYRADPARGREGTGLGLAIAHWIVTAHTGHIRAANAPEGGAIFTVTLPLFL